MTTLIIILSVIIGFLIAFYNAFVYKLYFTRLPADNKIVHRLGFFLRLFWIIAFIAIGWLSKISWNNIAFITLLNISLSWTLFDLVYNKIHNHKWYYSGTTGSGTSSFIDKLLNKVDEYIKGGVLVFTILWYPFYIYEILKDTILNRGFDLLIAVLIFIAWGYLAYRLYVKKERD